MKKEIDLLKKKIEKAKARRQELLIELNILRTLASEQRRSEDFKKLGELKKQILGDT